MRTPRPAKSEGPLRLVAQPAHPPRRGALSGDEAGDTTASCVDFLATSSALRSPGADGASRAALGSWAGAPSLAAPCGDERSAAQEGQTPWTLLFASAVFRRASSQVGPEAIAQMRAVARSIEASARHNVTQSEEARCPWSASWR